MERLKLEHMQRHQERQDRLDQEEKQRRDAESRARVEAFQAQLKEKMRRAQIYQKQMNSVGHYSGNIQTVPTGPVPMDMSMDMTMDLSDTAASVSVIPAVTGTYNF